MRFISVVLILGLVAGVFAAPVVNPDTETLVAREAEAEADPSCRGMACV